MKKTMKFISRTMLALALILVAMVFVKPQKVQAAGSITKTAFALENNKVYTQFDIDGDGRKDRFKVVYTSYTASSQWGEPYISVYLNGRYMTRVNHGTGKGGTAYLMIPKAGQVYLAMTAHWGGSQGNLLWLYRYKNRKFVKAYSHSLGEGVLSFATPYKVWSNGFSVVVSPAKYQANLGVGVFGSDEYSWLSPTAEFLVNYKIQNGKISLASRYCNVKGKYHAGKARRALRLSSLAATRNSRGPYLSRNAKAILCQLYINPESDTYSKPSYRFKTTSGRYGWVTASMLSGINWHDINHRLFYSLY